MFTKNSFYTLILLLFATCVFSGCVPEDTSNNEKTFSFIFMSDTQADPEAGDYTHFGKILESALRSDNDPRLLVLGGDNINDGSSIGEWELFWNAAGENLDGLLVASAAGNHDNTALLARQFDYPQTAPENNTEGFFYTFSENNVFFLILDSNIMGAGNISDAEWLSDQLTSSSATRADWRIAVLHHPFYPVADIPKDIQRAEVMRELFLPVMEENGVDLILCGHQHVYSRTAPMQGGVIEENGIIQIMTASGAKGSYSPGEKDYIAQISETSAYLIINAGADELNITAFNYAGEPFDNVQIEKIRRK